MKFILLIVIVILATFPLYRPGFLPTHDGEFHIIRFWQFEKMLRVGYLFPRWAPDLNSGFGLPIFSFHYPFPNYIGALFHALGATYTDAFKLALATGYSVAIVFCYVWLLTFFRPRDALVGTIICAFIPYWFVELYIRGAIGEVIAIGWMFVALVSIEKQWSAMTSIGVAGIVLSHNIIALIVLPLLVTYTYIRQRRLLVMIVVGLGLSAYFWIPALAEQRFMNGLSNFDFRDHFVSLGQLLVPSWGSGFSAAGWPADELSQQVGVIPLLVIAMALIFLQRKAFKSIRALTQFFLVTVFISFLLMLRVSQPVWEVLRPLQVVQYPWRLLMLLFPSVAFLGALVSSRKPIVWGLGLVVASIAFSYPYIKPVMYTPRDDAYYLTRREFTDGTVSVGNSITTRWSPWRSKRADRKIEITKGAGSITLGEIKPLSYDFRITAANDSLIQVDTVYFPGWKIVVDGREQDILYEHDGLMTFPVASGAHLVRVFFAETPIRFAADVLSAVCLFWLVGSGILKSTWYAYRNRQNTPSNRS